MRLCLSALLAVMQFQTDNTTDVLLKSNCISITTSARIAPASLSTKQPRRCLASQRFRTPANWFPWLSARKSRR